MKCRLGIVLLMTSISTIADAQSYYMRSPILKLVKSGSPAPAEETEVVKVPTSTPTPTPATPVPTPATPTPTPQPDPEPTDPTDALDPAPPLPEAQVGPSSEPATKPAGYVSPTTQPKPNQGCDGKSTAINGATASAMNQKVSFWSLGFDGFFIRFSVWRIRNANSVPVTVQLSGGLFSAKTVTVGAMSDSIAFSLSLGWTGEHQLRLYRGGQWVLIDRKTPSSGSYQGC
jgi:hypothetical protein